MFTIFLNLLYRVIHKSLRDFRPLRYSSRDGHAEGEHVNRGRDTSSFCPTLQVLDMSTLDDAADVNPVIKFLPHSCKVCDKNLITELTSVASPRVDISSICKVGQKLGSDSPSVDMPPFGVTIPATVPQRSEIPEGLMNYPVLLRIICNVCDTTDCSTLRENILPITHEIYLN